MPHELTPRQREYLAFIRKYIKENESAPQLMEIADHFHVTRPTASNMLKALKEKGKLYSDRDTVSGFYIRTPERYTSKGRLREVSILGNLDRYGEIHEFPKYHGHFPFMLPDDVEDALGIKVYHHIPSAGILGNDLLIVSNGGVAKPGDICIYPWGKRRFLVQMYALVIDENLPFYNLALEWEDSLEDNKDHLFWWPLVRAEDHGIYLSKIAEEQEIMWFPIPPDLIAGKVIRLVRRMAI